MEQINEKLIEKPISSERVYEGAIVNIRRDTVTLPNGKSATREVVEHPGAVAIVPVTDDGKVILVRQFRHPIGQLLLEIPAGKLDKGEHPDDCAQRELEEETGFVASQSLLSTMTETKLKSCSRQANCKIPRPRLACC
ncbi:MAG: hydrolase [Anaerosporomusa subterranea]|nr:hydrolase [Anaerosporomusa subterranea]